MKSKTVVQNTLYSLVEKIFLALTTFFLIPYIISKVGMKEYGVWVLFLSVSSYVTLVQFGLSASFEKYIAQFNALYQTGKLNELVVTSLYTLLGIGALMFIVVAAVSQPLFTGILKIPFDARYSVPFLWIIGATAVSLPVQVFAAIPRGFLRFDMSSMVSIAARATEVVVTVIALRSYHGVAAMAWGVCASNAVYLVLTIVVASRLLRGIPLHVRLFSRSMLKELYGFGINMQVSFFTMWVVQNVDKLIIGKVLGVGSVAVYDIGSKIVSLLRQTAGVLFFIAIPKTSELNAQNRHARLVAAYSRGSQLVAAFSIGMGGLLFPVAGDVLRLWLHRQPDPASTLIFRILIAGVTIHLVTGLGSSVARGIGRPILETYSNTVIACLNIGLSLLFFWQGGISGIAWGTSVACILGTVVFLALINKALAVRNIAFILKVFTLPIIVNVVLATAGSLIRQSSWEIMTIAGHPVAGSAAAVGIQLLIAAAVMFPAYIRAGLIRFNATEVKRALGIRGPGRE